MSIEIQRLNDDNFHYLIELFKMVFRKKINKDFLLKKYDTTYLGVKHLGYIALDKNKPVSYYGAIPYRFMYKNQIFIIPQSCDTMTHSDYRKKGYVTKLAKMTKKLLANQDIEFMFGFPNHNSYSFAKNVLSGNLNKSLHNYSFPVSTLPVEKICNKSNFINSTYKKYLYSYLNQYKSIKEYFPNILENSESAFVVHDKEYFNYKSFTDNFIIELHGVPVWIKVNNGIYIGSFGTNSEKLIKEIIKSLKKIAQKLGIMTIHFFCSEGTNIDLIMSSIQKPQKAWSTCIIPLTNKKSIPYDKFCFTYADFDTF